MKNIGIWKKISCSGQKYIIYILYNCMNIAILNIISNLVWIRYSFKDGRMRIIENKDNGYYKHVIIIYNYRDIKCIYPLLPKL